MGSELKKQLFAIVDVLRDSHPLALLLHYADLSRSGYYKWKSSIKNRNDDYIIEHIKAIHSIYPYYGYRRITIALKRDGININHKRVYKLMRQFDIKSIIRKKRNHFANKNSVVFPNLIARNFKASALNEKLTTDITYIPTLNGFIYLSAIMDLCNNEIIAYHLSARNNLELVFSTLNKLSVQPGAILHSDQGAQYTHKSYQERLSAKGLHGSHSRRGNCLDNAAMESFFSHLKTEAFAGKKPLCAQETMSLIDAHIRFYNTERFQKRLGQLSPVQFREKLAA